MGAQQVQDRRNVSPEPEPQETPAAGSGIGGSDFIDGGDSSFGVRDSQSRGTAPPFAAAEATGESCSANPETRIPDPGSSANPESPTPNPVSSPKPKRKYTVSDKSQASSLRNLQKANQAPKELKYRNTPRRQAARRKGLEKA